MNFEGIVFPGQGTQNLGMGKDFVEHYPEAKKIFEIGSELLQLDLAAICYDNEKLSCTEYAQPCILTVQVAMFATLQHHFKLSPTFFGGHSLGEYAALVASEVIPFEVAILMVRLRGQLMQSAVNLGSHPTGMVAIIHECIPIDQIERIALEHDIDLANDNSTQQVVLSGYKCNLEAAISTIKESLNPPPGRCVTLGVDGAFHSRHMQVIAQEFEDYIGQFKHQLNCTNLPKVLSNYLGGFYPDQEVNTLIKGLTHQISSRVKWRGNMEHLLAQTSKIIEIGPSAPLSGFFKSAGIAIKAITTVKSISRALDYAIHS